MKKTLILFITFLFAGCTNHYPPLKTVEKVDLDRYLGRWYEIARYEHSFEKGCANVSATYSLRDDNKIKVVNRCTKDGRVKDAHGIAYAIDDSYSKLKVSFFRPFYGNYQILLLDKGYQYAVIGEPSREYFWILSRTKTLDRQVIDDIVKKMPDLGYDASKLIWTPQN
ncbi:MAG: lipocalin family protein [Sulfurimonas sp.]